MCINYDKIEVYGTFNLTPMIPQLKAAARRHYGNLAVDWRGTEHAIREALICAVAARCRVADDAVLIDVYSEAPAARTRVYGAHAAAASPVLYGTVNSGNVEQFLQFIPQWGIA